MIRILYFAALVGHLGKTSEELTLPPDVTDVRTLLAWLRTRGGKWEQRLVENGVRVTINRQLVDANAGIDDNAEIGIIPTVPW